MKAENSLHHQEVVQRHRYSLSNYDRRENNDSMNINLTSILCNISWYNSFNELGTSRVVIHRGCITEIWQYVYEAHTFLSL